MIYSAYGVGVESDFALTCLPVTSNKLTPTIRLGLAAPGEAAVTFESGYSESFFQGRRVLTRSGGEYVFDVDGVGIFRMKCGDFFISCAPAQEVADGPLSYWLLRYLIPFHLAMNGYAIFFHGSAVRFQDSGVAFLADSHGGKSTLANYLREQGHTLITDDDLLITGEVPFMALPTIPFIRADRKQEDLGTRVENFDSSPAPLRKLYLLQLSDDLTGVFPLRDGEAATALFRHNRFQFIEKLAERFRFCARLASAISVARLVVSRDLSRLPDVRGTILADLGECS